MWRIMLISCLVFLPVLAFGEVYKCVAPDGKITLQNAPCPGMPQAPPPVIANTPPAKPFPPRNLTTKANTIVCATSWWHKEMLDAQVMHDRHSQQFLLSTQRCLVVPEGLAATVLYPAHFWTQETDVQIRLYRPDGQALEGWTWGYALAHE